MLHANSEGGGGGGGGGSGEGGDSAKKPLAGGYKRGDVVYSKIHFAFKDLAIEPGDKGVVTGPCLSRSVSGGYCAQFI